MSQNRREASVLTANIAAVATKFERDRAYVFDTWGEHSPHGRLFLHLRWEPTAEDSTLEELYVQGAEDADDDDIAGPKEGQARYDAWVIEIAAVAGVEAGSVESIFDELSETGVLAFEPR